MINVFLNANSFASIKQSIKDSCVIFTKNSTIDNFHWGLTYFILHKIVMKLQNIISAHRILCSINNIIVKKKYISAQAHSE